MPELNLPLFLACAFAAEVIGTMAGFGAATILTPIAALFMDVKTAITVVACFHLFGNTSRLIFFGRHVRWKIWATFGLAGIVCSVIGAAITNTLASAVVMVLFGLFLLSYVALSWHPATQLRLPASSATLMGGGALSGFIAGLLGTGGAIRSVSLLTFNLPTEVYLGTSAAIALVVDATRVPVYLAGGLLPARWWSLGASLIVVAFAGAWLGQRLVRRIAASSLRRFILVLLLLMGLKMLIGGVTQLASPS